MMTVRGRRADDLPALVEVLWRVHEQHRYPVLWPQDPGGWIGGGADVTAAWVATVDADPVGHASIVDHGDGTGWIERLFVDPRAAGSGLGRSLLRQATDAILSAELEPRLEVADNGEAAQHLYRSTGWVLQDRVPVDWGTDVVSSVITLRWPVGG